MMRIYKNSMEIENQKYIHTNWICAKKKTKYEMFSGTEFILLTIQCIFVLFEIFVENIDILAIISFFITIIAMLLVYYLGYGIVSIPTLFLVMTFVFHCSHFFIHAVYVNYIPTFDVIDTLTIAKEHESVKALTFYTISIFFFSLGLVLVRSGVRIKTKSSLMVVDSAFFRYIGKLFTAICILPRIYVDLTWFLAYKSDGYFGTFKSGISGIIQVISDGFYIGIIFLLLGYKNKPRLCRNILILVTVYSAFAMISGRRQEKVSYLLVIFFVFFRYIKSKRKIVNYIFVIIIFYLGVVTLATFGDLRHTGIASFGQFYSYFIQNLTVKMLVDQMMEFGSAGMTLTLSFRTFPSSYPLGLGRSYFVAIITLFPQIGNFLRQITVGYVDYIQTKWMYGLGGSFLGEAYYNFGWIGTTIPLFVGMIIGKISDGLEKASEGKANLTSVYGIILLSPIILWIRGEFAGIVRPFIWFSMFTCFGYRCFYLKRIVLERN